MFQESQEKIENLKTKTGAEDSAAASLFPKVEVQLEEVSLQQQFNALTDDPLTDDGHSGDEEDVQ